MPETLQQTGVRRIDAPEISWALAEFMHDDVGADCQVGSAEKRLLLQQFQRNAQLIPMASHWLEHLVVATEILRLPRHMPGVVVECGCFKGGSTANLSLACKLAGRKLLVCDSFAGLPAPRPGEELSALQFPKPRAKAAHAPGQYAGSLDEVRGNLKEYGCLEACEFLPGMFDKTLRMIAAPVVTAFIDVDLRSSLESCLMELWPRLGSMSKMFSRGAQDMHFVSLFFDSAWWPQHLGFAAPGFVGAGTGLPLGTVGAGSSLGFSLKTEMVAKPLSKPAAASAPKMMAPAATTVSADAPKPTPTFFFDPALLDAVSKKNSKLYREGTPYPHIVLDGLFPSLLLEHVVAEFPDPKKTKWKHCYHANSKKLSCADETLMGSVTRNLIAHMNSGIFLNFLEQLTGIEGLLPDPTLFGGGLHMIETGGFLKIHADFNIHQKLKLDRRLNVLVFLNQDWQESYGGHFEIWDREMIACQRRVLPVFNRFVCFSTTDWSYHGHPEPLTCPPDRARKSIAMYYYTNGRPADEVSAAHSTLYQRPRGHA